MSAAVTRLVSKILPGALTLRTTGVHRVPEGIKQKFVDVGVLGQRGKHTGIRTNTNSIHHMEKYATYIPHITCRLLSMSVCWDSEVRMHE